MKNNNSKRVGILLEITASFKSRIGVLILIGTIATFGAVWATYLYTNKPLFLAMTEESSQQFETNSEYVFLTGTLKEVSSLSTNINILLISVEQKRLTESELADYKLEVGNTVAELNKMNESTLVQKDEQYYRQLRRSIHDYTISVETTLKLIDGIVTGEKSWDKVESQVEHHLYEENTLLLVVNALLSKKMTQLKMDYENSYLLDLAIHESMRSRIEIFTLYLSILILFSGIVFMTINGKREIETVLLVENEEKYRKLMNSIPSPVFAKDAEGKYTGMNSKFEEWFGVLEEDAIGKTVFDLSPKDIAEQYNKMDLELFAQPNRVQSYECTIKPINSSEERNVIIYKSAYLNADGELGGLVGIILDITQRKKAEEALKKSEDRIHSVFKTVGEGIIVIDSDSKILLVNEEIKRIFGYAENELINRDVTLLIPDKYKQNHIKGFSKYIAGGSPQILGRRIELEGLKKNGGIFPIELRIEETIEESGNRYFTGAIRDISERKKAEGRAEMFYRMVEASGEGIGMANLDARVTYMNLALRKMIGELDTNKIYGKFIQEFYTPLARREIETKVMPQVMAEGEWKGETTMMDKDGNAIPVIENIFCVRNKDGSPSYFSTIVTDITERKKMEKEQIRLVKQSISALKEAEQANRLKSEFLANMSHELKTPLSSVLGFTRLALKGCEAIEKSLKESENLNLSDKELEPLRNAVKELKESAGYNDIALKQGEKLSGLINELLDLSLIEAGQLKLERARISAVTILASVRESISPMASAKGISLETNEEELNKSNILFWGDEVRLEQIVRNLAENGVKYSNAGRVTISIREVNSKLTVEVTDQGVGISSGERETIFERFRQLDGSATRSHEGMGLGLSLVKKLTEAMEGEIIVESVPTKGSTFKLIFPLEKVMDEES